MSRDPEPAPRIRIRPNGGNATLNSRALDLLTVSGARYVFVIYDPEKREVLLRPIEKIHGLISVAYINDRHMGLKKLIAAAGIEPGANLTGEWDDAAQGLRLKVP